MELTNSNLPPVIIDSEEKSNNDNSHKPSVKSYATRVFQESTIGIVSSIFSTHSKYRRVFKLFLSLLCVVGFIYCCVIFLNLVYKYPEVMDISQDRSLTYDMPAYTYCYNNPINRSVFCSLQPQHCEEPSPEFCEKFSSYCGANATLVPRKKYFQKLPKGFQSQWILKLGSVPNVLNVDKSIINTRQGKKKEDEISGPYLRTAWDRTAIKSCYSIHSVVESKQQPLQKQRSNRAVRYDDEVIRFYVNETEMMNPRTEPGVYFSVHSAVQVENPLMRGIFLKGGRSYKLFVEMQEEILLKAPFESNCMDYDELWEKNNRTGPRSKLACEHKCDLDINVLYRGCAPYDTSYPHKKRICGDDISSNHTTAKNGSEREFYFYDERCYDRCGDECRSAKYTTDIYVKKQIEDVEDEELHRHIQVEIYLSNDKVKVIRHSPKYETVEVISSIGGFMGCLLGIALMDILDVFGSILTVCSYSFRKRF